ncbi:MAG: DUF2330 domain-containing protein [Deltaproteobacteria bacterium]|nr:DUF2330 domain-containing protein [Deltaproteobacteria bacterium]
MRKTLVVGFALASLVPQAALACGGLFCSNSPVNQNAERVLFIKSAGRETTAVVQIQAQGNDPNFAWVVPLDAIPHDIHEEPSGMFNQLDFTTSPRYQFFNGLSAGVGLSGGGGCGFSASDASPTAAPGGSDEARSVMVWASGETSNFHFDVVSADDPRGLFTWLNANSYRTPEEANPIIAEYVSEHKFFIAFRLHSPAGVPNFLVSPVAFTYAGNAPCVPIRLTRIATAPTLPILTYVLSDQRAVPINFAQTTVADAEVARLGPQRFNAQVYDQLVGQAISEAGGRGWITEFAGPLPDGVRESLSTALQAALPPAPYLTRMYTTVDARNMDRDPEFAFSRGLPDVSNVHDVSRFMTRSQVLDGRYLLLGVALAGLCRAALRRRARA